MADFEFVSSGCEEGEGEDEKLISAVNYIIQTLKSKRKLKNEVKLLLADMGTHLSTLTITDEGNKGDGDLEEPLNVLEGKIMCWHQEKQSPLWHPFPDEGNYYDYLNAVDEVRKLTERLESLDKSDAEKNLLQRASDILQTAMSRLEEEFRNVLIQNKLQFEPEHMSSYRYLPSEDGMIDECSSVSCSNGTFSSLQRRSLSRVSNDSVAHLLGVDVVPYLRRIAEVMFDSHYDRECSLAYISTRKVILEDYLSFLGNKVGDNLDSEIKGWTRAIKIFMGFCLPHERHLCDKIFGGLGRAGSFCFVKSTESLLLQFLDLGKAICEGPKKPELFQILDLCEVLAELLPDIKSFYPHSAAGSTVQNDYYKFLRSFQGPVIACFDDFKNEIISNTSTEPLPGGGIHTVTTNIMNYLTELGGYRETLGLLFKEKEEEEEDLMTSPLVENEIDLAGKEDSVEEAYSSSPGTMQMAHHFHSFASVLELNLYDKSRLYNNASLQQIFLMNNTHYIAQKVESSELMHIFGDDWLREQRRRINNQILEYEKFTFGSILALLKDEGLQNPGSHSVSRTLLRERIHSFNLAFEELYRNQTAWIVSDAGLGEDLRISASLKLVQAYRSFLGRYFALLDSRNNKIKYSPDDLQMYLLDLFQGSKKSLHNSYLRL